MAIGCRHSLPLKRWKNRIALPCPAWNKCISEQPSSKGLSCLLLFWMCILLWSETYFGVGAETLIQWLGFSDIRWSKTWEHKRGLGPYLRPMDIRKACGYTWGLRICMRPVDIPESKSGCPAANSPVACSPGLILFLSLALWLFGLILTALPEDQEERGGKFLLVFFWKRLRKMIRSVLYIVMRGVGWRGNSWKNGRKHSNSELYIHYSFLLCMQTYDKV